MPEDLIRLCVGIEDADDLIDDLRRAVSDGLGSFCLLALLSNFLQLVQAGAVKVTMDGFQAVNHTPEDQEAASSAA